MDTLNIINGILAFGDVQSSDNPLQRHVDWTRKISNLKIKNPMSDKKIIPPGGTFVLFDGSVALGFTAGTSVLSLSLLSASDSMYRITINTGPGAFRTARSVSGISDCAVTLNNNAIAEFDFTGATLTAVQVGDVMRIKGSSLYDSSPFAFNPLNSGLWTVVAKTGTKVQCVRPSDQVFEAAAESAVSVSADVSFYSADGVQKGDTMAISGMFSSVSRRSYQVKDASATTLDFISTTPIPLEASLTYAAGAVNVYTSSKRIIYLEVDQDAVVRFNADTTSEENKVSPLVASDPCMPGFFYKVGDMYRCELVNKSVAPLKLKSFTAE